ncbi:MAG: hypothetical protein ACLUVX_08430 [Lachnospira pectinoschiza]
MGLFKNSRKAKNNVIIIGSKGTMRKTCIKPLSSDTDSLITGRILMNKLLINGKYADGCRQFTNKEILNALKRCFKLIDAYNYSDELDRTLSTRQAFCVKQTILNIINHNYNAALRYLELCIDNDGHGFDLIISMNEYVLYNCLITGFIEALEQEGNKE